MSAPAPLQEEARPSDEKEYYFLQEIVSGINKDCLEIKKWSVTAASAAAVVGQVGLSNMEPILLIIAILALVFWLTETVWRVNQWAFIRRIRELEAKNPNGPRISSRWSRFYLGSGSKEYIWNRPDGEASLGNSFRHFWKARTFFPHLVILVAALFFLVDPGGWMVEKARGSDSPIEVRLVKLATPASSPVQMGARRYQW